MTTTTETKLSLRKNDQVQVISGRDKGKTGKILRVDSALGKVTVEKINLVKRHVKPTQKNPQGGIMEKEIPLSVSKVLLMCPKCNRGVRHGRVASAKGKSRVCKRCGDVLDTV